MRDRRPYAVLRRIHTNNFTATVLQLHDAQGDLFIASAAPADNECYLQTASSLEWAKALADLALGVRSPACARRGQPTSNLWRSSHCSRGCLLRNAISG